MRKILFLIFILTMFINSQTYQEQWQEVGRLDKKNLPKSALKKVEAIYKEASVGQNDIETLHAVIKKIEYIRRLNKNGEIKSILFLEKELKKPYKNSSKLILKSILAQMYKTYQQYHSYDLSSRTAIKDDNSSDITTWSIDMFKKKYNNLYWDSLGDEAKYISIDKYKDILTTSTNTKELRPTLYDLLAFRILPNLNSEYLFDDATLFDNISTFINYPLYNLDKKSDKYKSLYIYQNLLKFHQEKGETKALQNINIDRLKFINEHFTTMNSKYYIDALKLIVSKNKMALYELASLYQNRTEYVTALRYAKEGVKSQNRYIINYCQNIINNIERKESHIQMEDINLPNDNILSKVSYRNVDKLYIKVIKLTKDEEDKLYSLNGNFNNYISSLNSIKNFEINLPKTDDYKKHVTEVSFGSYNIGSYIFVISKNSDFSDRNYYQKVHISKIGYLYRGSDFVLIDRLTGEPLNGVIAKFYNRKYIPSTRRYRTIFIKEERSNKDGFVSTDGLENNFFVEFINGKDRLLYNDNFNSRVNLKKNSKRDRITFFTDRAIYRPSQTIYFKGIAILKSSSNSPKVLSDKKVTVSLFNTNNQKVETKEFTTDEFGSFYGSFTAPKSGRMGRMYISSIGINGSKSIRVEEYKRAKFEVNFEPIKDEYSLGDNVNIRGDVKAFSGYKLADAKVHYKVTRSVTFPWLGWGVKQPIFMPSIKIDSGDIKSDKNGKFSIKFNTKFKDFKWLDKYKPTVSYEVTVDVTSPTGETQSGSKSINIGYISINANIITESEIEINKDVNITLNTTNLNGTFQPLKGKIVVEMIDLPKKHFRKRYWSTKNIDKPLYSKDEFEKLFKNYRYSKDINHEEKSFIKSIDFDTQKSKILELNGLEEGKYLLTLYIRDKNGIEVKKSKYITIYDLNSKNIPNGDDFWFKLDKKVYKPNSKATLTFKSLEPNRYVLLGLERDGKIKEEWIRVDRLAKKLIDIREKDLGNIVYQIATIKNNRKHIYIGVIPVPWDSKLDVKFITFRDKLKPNSKEQWKIKISGKDKNRVVAQMVATMYDASLDKMIASNFNPPYNIFPFNNGLYNRFRTRHFNITSKNCSWRKSYIPISERLYSDIMGFSPIEDGLGGGIDFVEASAPMATPVMRVSNHALTQESHYQDAYTKRPNIETKKPIHIRKNLKETMFFKPNLQTDNNGDIIIDFKTNDSLTKWNFLAFVHDKELKSAMVKKEIITQKDLMVTTNLPRFFREGDTIELTENIVNLSDKDLEGECEIKLTNPINEWNIYGDHKFIKPFKLKKGSSTSVKFYILVPTVDITSSIEHTVIARTKTHTDAEQVIKPILSNREFITDSKALWVRGNESKSFTLKSLRDNNSTTIKNYKLTLEFTSNPIWYALASMPYLMRYPHECNEQLFSRFFSNAVASKILHSNPKIKKVFDSWRAKGNLKSKLNLNKELKSAMIEDTPWLVNAQSEEQQQKNMALLFDLDKMALNKKKALDKLFKRENSDGGWAWFSGGESNWYITQYILEGFYKLNRLGIKSDDYYKHLYSATKFIDKEMLREYNSLLESVEKGSTKLEDDHLGNLIVQYLYVRKMHLVPFSKDVSKAYDYYLSQAKKYALKKSLYEQGLLALILNINGNKKEALAITKSIKENSISDEEIGIYFKNRWGYYWYQMPIETQSLMIKVFTEITDDKKFVEGLKIWLLKNKQTRSWKTTKATVNAIYALLIKDSWLNNSKLVDVSFDTKIDYKPILKQAKSLAKNGTGYFKASFNYFDKSMATVKVHNPNSNIAWGGLYWQYFEDLDKIKSFKETPLKVDKEIYILSNGQLIPISYNSLKVGDKIIVRLKIKADRDMEFVMLKDSRASAFEPTNILSQYKYQGRLGYYESTKDSASYFFFDYLPKGSFVFEYPLVVTHKGEFSSGIATIESMYAPEFRGHSRGIKIKVQN